MASALHLREIARIVREFGNKSSRSLFSTSNFSGKPSKMKQFAMKLATQTPQGTPQQWERAWAGEITGSNENERRYIILRSKVKRILLHRLFYLDIRNGPTYRKAAYQSSKELFWIRVLIMFGARKVAMWLVPRAMKRTRKFELTDDRVQLLTLLRYNAAINGFRTEFKNIISALSEATALRNCEERMQAMNDAINVQLVARAEPRPETVTVAIAYEAEAALIFKQYPTFNIGLNYFRIATNSAEASKNYRSLFRLCNESQYFLSGFPHLTTPLSEGQFALKRFRAAVAMHDFPSAHTAVPECARCFPEGNNNRFIWKQVEMLLYLHEQNFNQAIELHSAIIHHERFPSQLERVQQKWIYLGYYASFARWHENRANTFPTQDFQKVLTGVPLYKRDKGGFDASLLILQQLIYAVTGNRNALTASASSLERYIGRYLRGRGQTPLYAFIKMLLLLQKCEFDVQRTRIRGKRYIKQFSTYGHEEVDEKQSLPYTLMWEWISEGIVMNFPDMQLHALENVRRLPAVSEGHG